MTRSKEGELRARAAAERSMTAMGYSLAALSREAGVDPGTVGDFIGGKRWPRREKLAAIERALMLNPGTLALLAESDTDDSADVKTSHPPRTSPPSPEQGRAAAEMVQHQLHPGLRRFTDAELIREMQTRTLFYAARLTALGEGALRWSVADDGGDELVSAPPNGEEAARHASSSDQK
jgi:transcriptional regulator with XRE-family HTH domain